MTTLTALKDLYVKLGGSSSDVASITTNDAIVEKITEIAENGTAKIVTASRSASALGNNVQIALHASQQYAYKYIIENEVDTIRVSGPSSSDTIYDFKRMGTYGNYVYFCLTIPTSNNTGQYLLFNIITIDKTAGSSAVNNVAIPTAPVT